MAAKVGAEITNKNFPTLDELFDEQLEIHTCIENSSLPTNDLQGKISAAINKLEELTINISYLGVFSTNETIEEISTKSIKFLMLPVLLGSLTLKLLSQPREEILKSAAVYFKDFIKRCGQYQLTSCDELEDNDGSPDTEIQAPVLRPSVNNRPTPEDLRRMAKQREDKIAKYKERKALGDKISELKIAVENPSRDESVAREYYLTMIKHFIYISFDELNSIKMELDMLQQMKKLNLKKDVENHSIDAKKENSFRPFLITKDAVQKEVFGAGYPSLPVMSVDEFYEQRVKEGWFPPSSSHSQSLSKSKPTDENASVSDDSENEGDEERERLRNRDEWRDTHRTGWGNTYNRS